eukprot:Hpha_TRINITY_DN12717_c0_g2::TRINITY_DN12717_c0_g2_i1::g.114630::m.114630/K15258/PARP6_8; poly [ADP-ribose] polymerase 6/8
MLHGRGPRRHDPLQRQPTRPKTLKTRSVSAGVSARRLLVANAVAELERRKSNQSKTVEAWPRPVSHTGWESALCPNDGCIEVVVDGIGRCTLRDEGGLLELHAADKVVLRSTLDGPVERQMECMLGRAAAEGTGDTSEMTQGLWHAAQCAAYAGHPVVEEGRFVVQVNLGRVPGMTPSVCAAWGLRPNLPLRVGVAALGGCRIGVQCAHRGGREEPLLVRQLGRLLTGEATRVWECGERNALFNRLFHVARDRLATLSGHCAVCDRRIDVDLMRPTHCGERLCGKVFAEIIADGAPRRSSLETLPPAVHCVEPRRMGSADVGQLTRAEDTGRLHTVSPLCDAEAVARLHLEEECMFLVTDCFREWRLLRRRLRTRPSAFHPCGEPARRVGLFRGSKYRHLRAAVQYFGTRAASPIEEEEEMEVLGEATLVLAEQKWRAFLRDALGTTETTETELRVVDLLLAFCRAAVFSKDHQLVHMPQHPTLENDQLRLDMRLRLPSVYRIAQGAPAPRPEMGDLVRWVVGTSRCVLVPVPAENRVEGMNTPHQFVLLLDSPEKQRRFEALKKQHGNRSVFAFHGSAPGNWHSILRFGLKNASGTALMRSGQQHGPGIYLSPTSSLSFQYSKVGTSETRFPLDCSRSVPQFLRIGGSAESLRCIACCEVVSHNLHNPCPDIWVVRDEDLVATRFLFVYDQKYQPDSAPDSTSPDFKARLERAYNSTVADVLNRLE